MDFRNVTDKFSDKDFDGDPVRIKKTAAEDEFTEEDLSGDDGEPQIDPLTGKEVDFGDSSYAEIRDGFGTCSINSPEPEPYGQKKEKIYVAGIDVSILNERQQYLDANGKLITESMISYTKRSLKNRFRSLSNFLNEWNEADKKQAVIQELEKQGIILENLNEAVKANLDPFDLICHLAFDTPALTRKERAENVKKRNAFTKYGEQAGKVLEALLEKYAESGIENIEDMTVLNAPPLPDFGTPTEIVKWFGGKDSYKKAIKELEKEIYRDVA
jgi:type I restriction enzyme R subunit